MNIEVVARPEMKALAIRIPRSGRLVREAWSRISSLLEGHSAVTDKDHGYVFIPEWQWATEVTMLWVGVQVDHFDNAPAELERLTIPAKRFAKVSVQGDRAHMEAVYGRLFAWFRSSGHERDVRESSLGYEKNSLAPLNPFVISADKINDFNYEIYAPIPDLKKLQKKLKWQALFKRL